MLRIYIPEIILFIEDLDMGFYYDTYFNLTNYRIQDHFIERVQYEGYGWNVQFKYINSSLDLLGLESILESRWWFFVPYWKKSMIGMWSFHHWALPSIVKITWVGWNEFGMRYAFFKISFMLENIGFVKEGTMLTSQYAWEYKTEYLRNFINVNKIDLYLYGDLIKNIWDDWSIRYCEALVRPRQMVLYRARAYKHEFLLYGFEDFFRPLYHISILNPCYPWFMDTSNNYIYARQWVILAYMTFDKYAFFPSDSLWISNYFNNFFYLNRITLNYSWLYSLGDDLMYYYKIYCISNIFYILSLYIVFISNKTVVYSYLFLYEPFLFLRYLKHSIVNISALFKRIIRLRKLNYFKKIRKQVNRKSHVENYFFNLLKKYIFKRIINLNYKYIYNYKDFYNYIQKNFLSDSKNFKINFLNLFIFLFFFSFFFWFLIIIKNIFYYFYIFYYVRLRKYMSFFKYLSYRYSLRFYNYFASDIAYGRDIHKSDAYEAYRKLINYIDVHRKIDYKKKIKEEILEAYDATMWTGLSEWDEKRDEYINYFYSKIFADYYPFEEIKAIWYPRLILKYYLNADFSYNKIDIYNINTLFTFFWTKFVYLNVKKIIWFTFLRHFTYYRFWKVYYYYFYTMYHIKLDNFNNIFKIYMLYLYTLYMYIYLLFNNIYYFIFTEKRVLIKYYYKAYFNIANIYLLNVDYFKYIYIYFRNIYFFFIIFFNYLYDIIILCISSFYNRFWNFYFYIFRSDRGYSYNFWYKYYMLKFYIFEYNILFNIFISIRNLFFNFVLILMAFYLLSSLQIFYDFPSKYFIFYIKDLISILYDFLSVNVISYLYNIYDVDYFNANYKILFDNYINFYHNNFALYHYKIDKFITSNLEPGDYKYTIYNYDVLTKSYNFIYHDVLVFANFNIPLALDILFPSFNLGSWPVLLCMHLYLFLRKMPEKIMMSDMYWNFLPIWFLFLWKIKMFFFYYYLIVPLFWIWQYFFSFIVYYCLWITSYFLPLNYVIYYFFKIIYNLYVILYLFLCYFYYYYYYYFWIVLHNFLNSYFILYNLSELLKYNSIKFFIGLDIINFLKIILYSFILIFQSLFNGLFLFIYKIGIYISNFLGLSSLWSMDFFSIEISSKFRIFARDLYNCVLITDYYDIDDFNSIFSEYAQRKAGKKRKGGILMKHHKIKKSLILVKFRMIPFEYKVRGFLFSNSEILTHMIYYKEFFNFKTFYLYCFMLFSIYFNFFLILFICGFLFIKFKGLFKDHSHLYNSATYEWKTFVRKNRIKLGYDDFYWLYNLRWLKGFEFYLDKYFKDDLYMTIFKGDKMVFGIHLYETLNELFFFTNPTASELVDHNRYLKFRRYYFSRYTKMIKDIDYLYHIFNITPKQLRKKNRFFSMYKFFFPIWKKKKYKYNYLYETNFIVDLNRMDYVWLFFVTPYLLYERDWYDMQVFGQSLVSKQLYADLKKSLFKAYGVFEMNQKDVKLDLFEFQFFDKDFYNKLNENWGNVDKSADSNVSDNQVLRRIIYSRANTILLYTSYEKDSTKINELYNTLDYEAFLFNIEESLINLKNLNNKYFAGLIDFTLFSFVESISYTLTHLTPDIAKTAVDIEQGNLVGVSYKKSMLLDEFTSTEITENVFDSVDTYLVKENYNNMEMYRVLLREDPQSIRPLSSWWVIFVIIPFFYMYIELDVMFKYGRFILPHFAIIEWMDYVVKQFFSIYYVDPYLWDKIWWHDHINWGQRLKYQLKRAHVRTMVWDTRWVELQSFWYGEFAHLVQIKLDYAWFFVYKVNEKYYKAVRLDFFWDFYVRSLFNNTKSYLFFLLFDLVSFLVFFCFVILILNFIFYMDYLSVLFSKSKLLNLDLFNEVSKDLEKDKDSKLKDFKYKDKFEDLYERLEKHKRLSLFIYNYKKKEKEAENKKKEEEKRRYKF